MNHHAPHLLTASSADIAQAAERLRAGGLVAFPTETVYGLGADACNGTAVAAIYATKGRPTFNPLIVHLPDATLVPRIADMNAQASLLAKHFWPGPFTMVLPLKPGHGLSSLVTAGLETVAIRVPAHPVARALLTAFGGPVAAPSANPSGRISPTSAQHVLAGFDAADIAVIDAGSSQIGLESTIIAPGAPPRLLRAGGIAPEAIEAVLGCPLSAAGEGITAPGQLASHYAPDVPLRLNAPAPHADESYLGFGKGDATLNLSAKGDLAEAAANLFDHLHQLNAIGAPIAVAPVPEKGLGYAINDRLRRAAAPRPQPPQA